MHARIHIIHSDARGGLAAKQVHLSRRFQMFVCVLPILADPTRVELAKNINKNHTHTHHTPAAAAVELEPRNVHNDFPGCTANPPTGLRDGGLAHKSQSSMT